MKKRSLLISVATMSLLMAGLIGCGGKPADESKPVESQPATSQPAKPSSEAPKSSSQAPATSQPAAHVHSYAQVGEKVKNADDKDVYLMECADHDDKYIGVAFADYSAKDDDFDADAKASKYGEVEASLWDDAVMLAKVANTSISWKINVDKAIEGAKLAFGVTSTYATHGSQSADGKFAVKVNDGEAATWLVTGTFDEIGVAPTKREYLVFQNINLVAGENTITLIQVVTGHRWLFGGEMRVHYAGDAVPVAAPAVEPVPDAHKITFVAPAHVKVLVYPGPVEGDPVEASVAYSRDDTGAYAKYVAPVEDDPTTPDVDETVAEVKPEVNFKLQFEEGYYSDGNLMTISGTMGVEWNKLCCEDLDTYSVTKIKDDITITIGEEAGTEPNSFTANVTAEHCTVVFYQGEKNADGTNIDEGEAGKHNSMNKTGTVTRAKSQFNFEVFPEAGYEFAHGFNKGDELSPALVPFVTGRNGHFPGFGNFKVNKKNINLFSITKVATNLDINIACTLVA